MTLEDIMLTYADKGFAYLVAVYLLWRYHTTDREYLKVLSSLCEEVRELRKEHDKLLKP